MLSIEKPGSDVAVVSLVGATDRVQKRFLSGCGGEVRHSVGLWLEDGGESFVAGDVGFIVYFEADKRHLSAGAPE